MTLVKIKEERIRENNKDIQKGKIYFNIPHIGHPIVRVFKDCLYIMEIIILGRFIPLHHPYKLVVDHIGGQ